MKHLFTKTMQKSTIIILAVIVLTALLSIGVIAYVANENNAQKILQSNDMKIESSYSIDNFAKLNNGEFNSKSDAKKYENMISMLESFNLSDKDFHRVLFEFEYLSITYAPTPEEQAYLLDLIAEHKEPLTIFNIYSFWTDTNEELGIIEQVFNLRNNYSGLDFWIEDAFNEVTENKWGVLSVDDIDEYVSKGLSYDDIVLANVLCRKGVLTIKEILDEILSGKTFSEVESEIDSHTNVSKGFRLDSRDINKYKNLKSDDILKGKSLARLTGENENYFYDKIQNNEDAENISFQVDMILTDLVSRNIAQIYEQYDIKKDIINAKEEEASR